MMLTDTDLDAHAAAIERDGFTILHDLVGPEVRAPIVDAIDRVMRDDAIAYGANAFLGEHTRRIFNLLSRDPVFVGVPLQADVLALVERVLDRQCLLSSLTAIEMHPGQAAQPWHADDGSVPLPRPHVPLACVAIWALTDFTAANGATRLVPGSHRGDRIPRPGDVVDPAEVVEAEMRAGSVLVYNGSLWHGGGENTTDERRLGIVVNHCAGWVRQEECQLLALPRDLVATFPTRLQQLVGYGTYRGLIGHVDQRDPRTLVDPDAVTDMIWRKMR
jgi:ectoine hydroxylase-related dioxygenase (phytanoyl-CoA dioxygenase family)